MTITRIGQSPRMSQAVIANTMVYLAGLVASGTGIVEQTQGALAKIDSLLEACGSSKDKLVNALISLADVADFDGMNAVWDAWVKDVDAPARATIQAPLAYPEILVEIVVVATL